MKFFGRKSTLYIGYELKWSWKRILMTFFGVYMGFWGILEPIGAFTNYFSLLNRRGLILLLIASTSVTIIREIYKRRDHGQIFVINFIILITETGEQWNVKAPWDLLVDQFIICLLYTSPSPRD